MNNEEKPKQIGSACATCKHFRLITFKDFKNGVDMCTRNVFDSDGHRLCRYEKG